MPIAQINPETMFQKPAPYVDILQEGGFEVRYPSTPELSRGNGSDEDLVRELQEVDAVIATAEHYNERVLSLLPKLRVIARAGVGYDRVDVEAATRHKIAVTITPTANHEAVAELALALLFAATKRILPGHQATLTGQWPRTPLMNVRRKTMGIFGLGRIGRSLAVRSMALGMNVIATERFPDQQFVSNYKIELVEFDALLAQSDFISIHCPLNNETRGLFNRKVFNKMKPNSILINTARGPLVVEADLNDALRSGHLHAAALDVFEQEPPSPDNPLFELENVVTSPHIAGADDLSLEAMGVEAAECIVKLYRGEWPDHAGVNSTLKDSWAWTVPQ